ncbi:MAG: GspH/FimT family pseudopilin [Betaproteobacteria bacterium]|nr:GspH/FimT family pseudopilin [Betaproteobacteria bacterium]
MKKLKGITLIELLVTITVVAILAMIGLPSFRNLILSNNVSKEVRSLQDSIELARSNALKTGLSTIVCPANDDASGCLDVSDWRGGWLVAVSKDGCSSNDIDDAGPIQVVGRISSESATYFPFSKVSEHNWLCFNRMGVSPKDYSGKFVFNVEGKDEYKRCVYMSGVGGVQVLRDKETDNTDKETC